MKATIVRIFGVGASLMLAPNEQVTATSQLASLTNVAARATATNPALLEKDRERKAQWNERLSLVSRRHLKEGEEQNDENQNEQGNYNGNGGYSNNFANYDWDMDEEGFGFDITSYAIKYTGCATVQTYTEDLVQDEDADTILAAQRFALFRLCPANQCSSYSARGCASNYGEYVVSLEQYLYALWNFQTERNRDFCLYCQNCALIESAKHFYKQVESTKWALLEEAEQAYETWYNQYGNQYSGNSNNNNNDDMYSNVNAAKQYYKMIRNGDNFANNYVKNYNGAYGNNNNNGNYAYQANVQQNSWTNENYWQFQQNQNQQQQTYNQNSWSNMVSQYGTFYGRTVVNGYYDNYGNFNVNWGYLNGNGNFVSLQDGFQWDETLFGEQPDGWDEITEDTQSCNYQFASPCINQYDACMQILADEQQDNQYQDDQYQDYQYQDYQNQGYQGQATLKDFLECTEIEVDGYALNNEQAYYDNGYQGYDDQNNQNYQGYDDQNQGNAYDNACDGNDDGCQQNQKNAQSYGRQYFVGPHCGSDGRSISLAVYYDKYCSVYDSSTQVEDLLGYSPIVSSFDLMPDECIDCAYDFSAQQEYQWYIDGNYYNADAEADQEQQANNNNNNNYYNQNNGGVEIMCSMLYQLSGKCNVNLQATEYSNNDNANGGSDDENGEEFQPMYQSRQQSTNEETVCAFIDILASDSYDEHGKVVLESTFQRDVENMKPGTKLTLTFLIFATIAMGYTAYKIQSELARKNVPWIEKDIDMLNEVTTSFHPRGALYKITESIWETFDGNPKDADSKPEYSPYEPATEEKHHYYESPADEKDGTESESGDSRSQTTRSLP